jgi:hypothetical protein
MLTFYPSRIPDPGVKKATDPGSGSATLNKTEPDTKHPVKKREGIGGPDSGGESMQPLVLNLRLNSEFKH